MKRNLAPLMQKGFTMIELVVVLAIIAVLAVIGLPAVQSMQMEGRAPEVAKVVQSAIVKLKNNREGQGVAAWATASTQELASTVASDSRVTVTGTKPNQQVQHNIGGSATGLLTFARGTVLAANDGGMIQAVNVSGDACPIFANSLQKFAGRMLINTVVVKAGGGAYNGALTQTTCNSGDTNTIQIHFN